jgi:hypothetical protein
MTTIKYEDMREGMNVLAYNRSNYGRYIVILRIVAVLTEEVEAEAYYHEQIQEHVVKTRYERYDILMENKYMTEVEWFELNDDELISSVLAVTI